MNSNRKDIFGPGSQFDCRLVKTYEEMTERVRVFKQHNQKIVLTMGTFDILHIGHFRYLEKAKAHGDFLIVGVDSDEKVKNRKGPTRPLVPEEERLEALTHSRHVDLVFLKKADDVKWQLIKTVRPNTFVVTQETYDESQLEALGEFCGEVVVLKPQATTTTTAKIRLLLISHLTQVEEALQGVLKIIEQLKGGKA